MLKGLAGGRLQPKGNLKETGNLWKILHACSVKSSPSTTDWSTGSALALQKGSRSTTRRLLVQVCWNLLAHPAPSKALVPQPPPRRRQAAGSSFYEHPKSMRNHKTTLGCRQPIATEAKAGGTAWSSPYGEAHQEVDPLGSSGGHLLSLCQDLLVSRLSEL